MANNKTDSPKPDYMMGYSDEFLRLLYRRRSEVNAAYLLPYLKTGMRTLDFGCGPGTKKYFI